MWEDDGTVSGLDKSFGRLEGGEPGSRSAARGERLPLAGQGMDERDACGDSGDAEVAGVGQGRTGGEAGASKGRHVRTARGL